MVFRRYFLFADSFKIEIKLAKEQQKQIEEYTIESLLKEE